MTMTRADVQQILEKAARATAEPWVVRTAPGLEGFVEHPREGGEAFGTEILMDDDYPTKAADVEFIAAARGDVPALCGALTEALDEIAALRLGNEEFVAKVRLGIEDYSAGRVESWDAIKQELGMEAHGG